MIELAQHIEYLLLENDCVIVPGFGGFVTHYSPATQIKEENLFLPPSRTIGFNPQLKLNDGVLVQSYMAMHDTNFADATKKIERQVSELIAVLHQEGKADLENVGELRYTIRDTFEFIPYDNKITTPYLYGLDSFEMKELSMLKQPSEKVLSPAYKERKKTYEIKVSRTLFRNAVAAVAAVILFFAFSTPVENTYIEKSNYAQLLPTELFESIEKQSVVMTPVAIQSTELQTSQKEGNTTQTTKVSVERKKVTKPIAVKEVKVAPVATPTETAPIATPAGNQNNDPFHIIVAGGIPLKVAETVAEDLKKKGFAGAQVINKDGKVRVSILSCSTREEATRQLLKIRENETYKSAWMLAE